MANLDFDYNDNDYQLIAEQIPGGIVAGDYIRVIIYGMTGDAVSDRIFNYGSNTKAIFYSALHEDNDVFNINISPFIDGVLSDTTSRAVGGDSNDFKVYKNPTSGNIFIKPNEIFDMMEDVGDGNYQIKIDFLRQLNPLQVGETIDDPEESGQGQEGGSQ